MIFELHIGVVTTMFPTGKRPAYGHFIREQVDHLAQAADVRLFAPMPNRIAFEGNPFGPGALGYPSARPFLPAFPRGPLHGNNPALMAFFLNRHRSFFAGCNLIHAHAAFPSAGASVRAFGGSIPVVVTVHGSDVNDFAFRPALGGGIRDALNRARCIIAVSESLRDTLVDLGVRSPVRVIPNGVDTVLFSPGDKSSAARKLGLAPDRPRILFIGNFVEVKNAEQLIAVMPGVIERYPSCELVLVGAVAGNPSVATYRRMISERRLERSVTIVPMLPHADLPDWIRSSDLLVLPSRAEGFGLVLAEALACGRPVVATRCGGPERIVEPGCGALVPVDDNTELTGAMERVLSGKGVLTPEALAENARKRFSWDGAVIPAILDVYREVLSR
jgi:teichuronic acid biosynthesis glycosyltransferase TuaC